MIDWWLLYLLLVLVLTMAHHTYVAYVCHADKPKFLKDNGWTNKSKLFN